MSKRSNRTRGNRPLNMGRSLRARQMTPGPVRKRPGGGIEVDPDVSDPTVYPIWDEAGVLMVTENDSAMVMQ